MAQRIERVIGRGDVDRWGRGVDKGIRGGAAQARGGGQLTAGIVSAVGLVPAEILARAVAAMADDAAQAKHGKHHQGPYRDGNGPESFGHTH